MNKLLLTFVALFATFAVSAQCSELFISEYVEGSYNNKALELYNPSNDTIDLSGYTINRYSNGSTSPQGLPLAGELLPGETYVIVIDKQDPTGTGYDTIVYDGLRAKADTFMSGAYPGPLFYNGNDAVTLEKTDGTLVDIIGVKGQDPGQSWTCDATAGFTDLNGGRWTTKNTTLVRHADVQTGTSTWPTVFNACAEWDTLPNNTFDSLGMHRCDCQANSFVNIEKEASAYFFPNPVTQDHFTIIASEVIETVEIVNIVGQQVYAVNNANKSGKMNVELEGLTTGIYMVRILLADNTTISRKLIIK
jgi:hypothetical protein